MNVIFQTGPLSWRNVRILGVVGTWRNKTGVLLNYEFMTCSHTNAGCLCRPVSSIAFNYIHKVAWVHSSIHKQNTTLAREHFEAKYSGVQWCCSKCTPDLLYTLIVSPLACYAVLLAHQVDILALCSWVPDMLQIKAHLCVQPKTSDSSQPFCHGLWACTLIWGAEKTKLIHSKWWLGGSITFCPDPNHNPDLTIGCYAFLDTLWCFRMIIHLIIGPHLIWFHFFLTTRKTKVPLAVSLLSVSVAGCLPQLVVLSEACFFVPQLCAAGSRALRSFEVDPFKTLGWTWTQLWSLCW